MGKAGQKITFRQVRAGCETTVAAVCDRRIPEVISNQHGGHKPPLQLQAGVLRGMKIGRRGSAGPASRCGSELKNKTGLIVQGAR
jgi:hypothetical protein